MSRCQPYTQDSDITQIIEDLRLLDVQKGIRHKIMTCLRLRSGFEYVNSIRSRHHDTIDINTGRQRLIYKRFPNARRKKGEDMAHYYHLHPGTVIANGDNWCIEELIEGMPMTEAIQKNRDVPCQFDANMVEILLRYTRRRHSGFGHVYDIHHADGHASLKEYIVHLYIEQLTRATRFHNLWSRMKHVDRYIENLMESVENTYEGHLVHGDLYEGMYVTDDQHVVVLDYGDMQYSIIEHDLAPLWIYERYFDIPLYSSIHEGLVKAGIVPRKNLIQAFAIIYVLKKLGSQKHGYKKWTQILDTVIGYRQTALWKSAEKLATIVPRNAPIDA